MVAADRRLRSRIARSNRHCSTERRLWHSLFLGLLQRRRVLLDQYAQQRVRQNAHDLIASTRFSGVGVVTLHNQCHERIVPVSRLLSGMRGRVVSMAAFFFWLLQVSEPFL